MCPETPDYPLGAVLGQMTMGMALEMKKEPEATWLRLRVIRLRAALRYALEPRVEIILRETVIDMEERLEQIESVIVARSPSGRTKLPQSK